MFALYELNARVTAMPLIWFIDGEKRGDTRARRRMSMPSPELVALLPRSPRRNAAFSSSALFLS